MMSKKNKPLHLCMSDLETKNITNTTNNISLETPNVKRGLSQCDRIIRHMKDYGSITSLEAMQEYGIMRLASRINDLRKLGYNIQVITETGKNRYGEKTSYARYSLPDKES